MARTKLSDKQIAHLLLDIATRYNTCRERNSSPDMQKIYSELYSYMHYSIYGSISSKSTMNRLDQVERENAFRVLRIFIASTPEFEKLTLEEQQSLFTKPALIGESLITRPFCCKDNDKYFEWSKLRDQIQASNQQLAAEARSKCCKPSRYSGAIMKYLILSIAALAGGLAFVALYYLLSQTLDNAERIMYDEGWLQAFLSFFAMAAAGTAAALLSIMYLQAPIVALAVLIGINPLATVIVGITCLTIIGAAFGCFITNLFQNSIRRLANSETAADPKDPNRYGLSEANIKSLEENNKDVSLLAERVACILLRSLLGNEGVPPFLNRSCSNKNELVKTVLSKTRQLREGEINLVDVGRLKINCLKDNSPAKTQYKPPQQMGYQPPPGSQVAQQVATQALPEYVPIIVQSKLDYYISPQDELHQSSAPIFPTAPAYNPQLPQYPAAPLPYTNSVQYHQPYVFYQPTMPQGQIMYPQQPVYNRDATHYSK